MTRNFNMDAFRDKKSDLYINNDSITNDLKTNGKCNNCVYFKFGKGYCEKRGQLHVTYREETAKGGFINFIKPYDCTDYMVKGSKPSKEGEVK